MLAWWCLVLLGRGGALAQDADGWTVLPLQDGARRVFVSSSTGDDENSGATADQAKRTLAAGRAMLRDGRPDRLLLRRGDVWEESLEGWRLSGAGDGAPMVIESYGRGDMRPVVRSASGHAFSRHDDVDDVSHLAIVGIRFESIAGDTGAGGLWWLGGGNDLLIEDCVFDGGANGIVIQMGRSRVSGVRIRRSIVVGVGSRYGHPQGLYAWGVDGLLVEGCVFVGDESDTDLRRGQVRVGTDNSGVVVRGNLIVGSPGCGVRVESGGEIEGNVIARCPRAIALGGGGADPLTHTLGVSGVVRDNVVLDCDQGIVVENIGERGAEITGNVLVRGGDGAIVLGERVSLHGTQPEGVGVRNVRVRDNAVHDWVTGLRISASMPGRAVQGLVIEANRFSGCSEALIDVAGGGVNASFHGNVYAWHGRDDPMIIGGDRVSVRGWERRSRDDTAVWATPDYADAGRSLSTYNALVGGAGTIDVLLGEVLEQSRMYWREAYAPASIASYVRDGFGLKPNERAGVP